MTGSLAGVATPAAVEKKGGAARGPRPPCAAKWDQMVNVTLFDVLPSKSASPL
jgi:hypothetical protein